MWNEELEKAALYYIIFQEENFELDEYDFINEKHKKIIKAINELKAEGKKVSIMSVQSKINAKSSDVLSYLSTLGDYVRTSNPDDIYNDLIELSKKRKLFDLLKEKVNEIENAENIDILSEQIIKDINIIQQVNEKEKTFLEQVVKTSEMLEQAKLKGVDYSLYTGLRDLDDKMCGLHNQELTIIGARPRRWKNNPCITNS
jgi:replicative DNA helicase